MKSNRLIALLLALALILSCAACGPKDTNDDKLNDESSNNAQTPENSEPIVNEDGIEVYFDYVDDSIQVSEAPWYRGTVTVYETAQGDFKKKTDDKTLVIGSQGTITYCDPAQTQQEYNFSFNVYDSLLNVNRETGEYEPSLATEWEYDGDGNLHITLREDVKFHDGTIMNAEDVIYSLQRVTSNPKCKAYEACMSIDFEKSYIEDDLHLVLVFKYVYGSFLGFLASNFTGILSKEFMEDVGEDYDFLTGDAGCGAYKLVETVTGLSQTFVRFEDYWGGCPDIETIFYRRYEDKTAMSIDFENGDLDVMLYANYDAAVQALSGELTDTTVYRVPNNRMIEVTMKTNSGPLADVRIRQALAHCVNWEDVVYAVNGSLAMGSVATSVFPFGIKHAITTGEYEYDPEKAVQLLADAGYSTSNPVVLQVISSSGTSNEDEAATVMQQYCKAVGIDLQITLGKSGDLNALLSNHNKAEADIIMKNTDLGAGIPATWLTSRDAYGKETGTFNEYKGIIDETFHNLYVEAESTTDEAKRAEVYEEMQKLIYDNVWYMMICPNNSVCMFRDYVQGDVGEVFLGGQTVRWSALSLAD